MFRLSLLVLVLSAIAYCYNAIAHLFPLSQVPLPMTPATRATHSDNLMIKQVTLQAREEKHAPVGISPTRDRDIGFADIFVKLENPEMIDISLTIQRVEIQDSHTSQVYLAMQNPKQIHLRPMEFAVSALHLKNKAGYPGHSPVKAVVIYQLQGVEQVIESSPVEITRY